MSAPIPIVLAGAEYNRDPPGRWLHSLSDANRSGKIHADRDLRNLRRDLTREYSLLGNIDHAASGIMSVKRRVQFVLRPRRATLPVPKTPEIGRAHV